MLHTPPPRQRTTRPASSRSAALALATLLGLGPPASASPLDPGSAATAAAAVSFEGAKLLASLGTAGDGLGSAIAVSGRTVVVAAPGSDSGAGSAWVYREPAAGWGRTLLESARLVPSDTDAFDRFGISIAIDGGIVVVGAYGDDDNGSDSGSAYVFVEPRRGWAGASVHESAKLLASDGAPGDSFGVSVAVSAGTIVVGAYGDDDNGVESGSAYVFTEPPGGWAGTRTEDAKLLASDGAADDQLGTRVAVSGSTVVVGAPVHDMSGAAYVFNAPSHGWAGTRNEDAELLASDSDGTFFDNFGIAVAVSGPTVVVGADGVEAAYVFTRPAGGWAGTRTETARLTSSDGAFGDSFGASVGISGPLVVVGASNDDDSGSNSGSAYVFVEPAEGWAGSVTEDAKLLASDGSSSDFFGAAVAVSGLTIVSGASRDDDSGTDSGSAYVFGSPLLFADGFESGDLAAWSSVVP